MAFVSWFYNRKCLLPVTAEMLTPLLWTFSDTVKRVKLYFVPIVSPEVTYVTDSLPISAVTFISLSLNAITYVRMFPTLFHCRVTLVSSCPTDLKPTALAGARI